MKGREGLRRFKQRPASTDISSVGSRHSHRRRHKCGLLSAFFLTAAGMVSPGGCVRRWPEAAKHPLTTVEQVRRLSPEAAAAQPPVRLRGAVTFSDGALWLLFVQDATGAIRVEGAPLAGSALARGRMIEVAGTASAGWPSPSVISTSIHMSDQPGPLPAPVKPSAQELISGRLQYRYVEVEGPVKSAVIDRGGKLALVIRALGWDIRALVRDLFPSETHSLVDSVVRAHGVLVTSFDARGRTIGVKLWVAAAKDIAVESIAPAAEEVPFRTARSILSRTEPSEHQVRLRGSVSREDGKLLLRDSSGVPLRAAKNNTITTRGPVDILGFTTEERGAPVLTECRLVDWARKGRRPSSLPPLVTVGQIKALSEDQARVGYPVRLQVIVTYRNPLANNTFAIDETGGIYLALRPGVQPAPQYGDRIEVEGSVGPGDFAPIVSVTSLRITDRQPLPPQPILKWNNFSPESQTARGWKPRGWYIRSGRKGGCAC